MKMIINLILRALKYIIPLIPKLLEALDEKQSVKSIKKVEAKGKPKPLKNISSQNAAIKYLNKHKYAYQMGCQEWDIDHYNGRNFNNILYTIIKGNKYKVFRMYDKGEYLYIDKVLCSDADYKNGMQTYCNLLVSAFCNFYAKTGRGTLQKWEGKQISADKMIAYFKKDVYDFGGKRFHEVTRKEAEKIAKGGGFVVVSWYNVGGDDHVAVLIGKNKIYQTGIAGTGQMTIDKGFGPDKKLRFWSLSR
jgi:hypothetical protein